MKKHFGILLISASLIAGMLTSQLGCPGNVVNGSGDGGTDDGGTKPAIEGLESLTISPTTATLTTDNTSGPKTQPYVATGHFNNGQPDSDVSSRVNWKIDNTAIGSVSTAGVFTTSNRAGGQGTLTASSGNISATAQVIVNFNPVVNDASAPANAGTLLPPTATGTVVTGSSPAVLYPSANTIFPRNIYKILFTFTGGTGNDLYRLEFKSPLLTLSVYTTATSWTPTQQQWAYMADTNAGGKVTWTYPQAPKGFDVKFIGAYERKTFKFSDFTDVRTGNKYSYNADVLQLFVTASF